VAKARVTWIEGGRFVGIDGTGHGVVLSTQEEGEAVGMSPSQLLLVSLASCTAVDVVRILAKKRQRLLGLEIQVTGEQEPDPPWPYTKIHLSYRLRGDGLSERAIERAIGLSESKYCSVAATLRPQVDISYSYEIEGVGDP
jgi:putative redox protein